MREIILTNSYLTAKIDDEDYDKVINYKWHLTNVDGNNYVKSKINGKVMNISHIILESVKEIDHKDGNGLNNQKDNLREATRYQQGANQRLCIDSSSNYKGVSRYYKGWKAYIRVRYKYIHLGVFTNKLEAASAYNEAAIKYFGEFANLNKIEEGLQ